MSQPCSLAWSRIVLSAPGIILFTYHKYLKSITSTVPLDAHGNPLSDPDIEIDTPGVIGLQENSALAGNEYNLVRYIPAACFTWCDLIYDSRTLQTIRYSLLDQIARVRATLVIGEYMRSWESRWTWKGFGTRSTKHGQNRYVLGYPSVLIHLFIPGRSFSLIYWLLSQCNGRRRQ